MNTTYSTNRKFKRMFANILSIFVILAIAFANTGFPVQAAQRTLPGDWDVNAVRKASVLHEEGGYKMWYDGVNFFDQTQIGLATSDDGTSWMKYSDNPVLIGGAEAWDSSGEHAPFVMKDGDVYKMWYEGSDGSVRQLGYATSSDGITWTKYEGNPVLQVGPEGYDQSVAGHGSVLYEDGVYKLWYHAIGDQGIIIAYATSPDGINWTKEGPVLLQEAGLWDEGGLWGPSVLKVGITYWMWYSAGSPIYPASIGAATSTDGVDWTRAGEAPVITIADNYLGDPHVIFDEGIFKMWFNNFSEGKIYYAESSDGINWVNFNPALTPGVLFPLEGWHDGNEGEVDANNCSAFGWAVDPDDRDRDVEVRILVDGESDDDVVTTVFASDYGADMDELGICPEGTCRFTVNLWGLISPGEEHQITVQAYDMETADWWNLEGTSKSLICLTPPPPNPFIAVSLTIHWISLNSFTPDTLATISVYESEGSSTSVFEVSRYTDASGNLWVEGWEPNWDLEPGNYVVATDGVITKELVLEYVTLDVFDPENDLVSGMALPGRELGIGAGNADDEQWMTVFADGTSGVWTADFKEIEFDLTEDMWAGAHVSDEDGDVTASHNSGPPSPPPGPRFVVFPEWEWFDGLDWPDGAIVSISVEGKSECYLERESWGGFFNGNFPEGCDIEIGDTVTFTDGETVRTHTVRNLAITKVNQEDDTVKGIADAGAEVYVWPHATGQEQLVIAKSKGEAKGKWNADFTGIFDLVPGECGRSEIRDESGNATAVDWCIPNPRFSAFPEWEYIEGWEWPQGAIVHMTIDDPGTEVSPDFSQDEPVLPTDWDPNLFWVTFNFAGMYDMKVGDIVTLSDGTTTRTHTVLNLAITGVDADANTVSGTADADAVVNVWPHATGEQVTATADSEGNWQVDISAVFDLVPGECGRAEIRDRMDYLWTGATAVDWCVSNPRIVVQITDDWFRAENFQPNISLSFLIYDAPGGSLLLSSTTEPTDDSGTVTHWVGDQVDLVPGNYVIVSDKLTTREILLEALAFDVFDTSLGILQGTAPEPFGRAVSVGIGCWERDDWNMDVTTDENGAWTADFGAPVPNDYGCVYAWVYDEDGDVSEVRPSLRTLTAGNFYVAWSQTNPEEVIYLSWNGSGNLTNTWTHPACSDDLEFFGNSWASENEGEELLFFASLVGWGTTGTWTGQTSNEINIGSISSGCPGSADIPINTQYQFFEDEVKANLIMIQRKFDFGDNAFAHDVRPFIPRLYPSDGFTQVLHPNANGDELVTDTTCDFGCVAESWDGSWFAMHNPATGLGLIVQQAPSSYSSALWLDDDDGSFTNSSSVLLLQPAGGFIGPVTETEYLCFYDTDTWSPSLNLPAGCQP